MTIHNYHLGNHISHQCCKINSGQPASYLNILYISYILYCWYLVTSINPLEIRRKWWQIHRQSQVQVPTDKVSCYHGYWYMYCTYIWRVPLLICRIYHHPWKIMMVELADNDNVPSYHCTQFSYKNKKPIVFGNMKLLKKIHINIL